MSRDSSKEEDHLDSHSNWPINIMPCNKFRVMKWVNINKVHVLVELYRGNFKNCDLPWRLVVHVFLGLCTLSFFIEDIASVYFTSCCFLRCRFFFYCKPNPGWLRWIHCHFTLTARVLQDDPKSVCINLARTVLGTVRRLDTLCINSILDMFRISLRNPMLFCWTCCHHS